VPTTYAIFSRAIRKSFSYLILTTLAVIFLLPFIWMTSTALKIPSEIYSIPPEWIPDPVTFDNFAQGWNYVPFAQYSLNTLIITILGTLGILVSSSLVAYGFARFDSRLNGPLFMVVIATMMLPSQITLIPSFILYSKIGWTDTYLPLLLPGWLGGGAFNIFLLRQFFRGIPRELDQAAKIDGCSSFGIFTRILLPSVKPALTSVGVMAVIYYWNDFMGPLIYLSTNSKFTISIGLQYFNNSYGMNKVNLLMAVSLVTVIPVLVLFFFCQRYFVQGITVTGLKG
jgi:multiple sugar transport system permease protein